MNALASRAFAAPAFRRLESGALVRQDYRPPAQPEGCGLTTCSGVVIGGAIAPALPAMSADAEQIQAGLLASPRKPLDGHSLIVPACAAAAVVLLLLGLLGVLPK